MLESDKTEMILQAFPSLERDLIAEIGRVSSIHDPDSGTGILEEGEYIKFFPMVISGCLRVVRLSENGNELLLYYLNSGEICSMALTCCIGVRKSNIRMITEEKSIILLVPAGATDKWISEYRTWKEFIMNSYKRRFDELLETIDSIAYMKLDERIEKFFRDRYISTGKTVFAGTHQEIAIRLNTSREVVSRLLKNLELKGKVKLGRNSVEYQDLVIDNRDL
jgi:CRP/FNR family transcriptional regulator, anaerobic regulatory protein